MKIEVQRPTDTVIVSIMYDRNTDQYCFVNLTKGHVCSCRFASKAEALFDLEEQKKEGKVLNYIIKEDDYINKQDLIKWLKMQKYILPNVDTWNEEFEKEHQWKISRNYIIEKTIKVIKSGEIDKY